MSELQEFQLWSKIVWGFTAEYKWDFGKFIEKWTSQFTLALKFEGGVYSHSPLQRSAGNNGGWDLKQATKLQRWPFFQKLYADFSEKTNSCFQVSNDRVLTLVDLAHDEDKLRRGETLDQWSPGSSFKRQHHGPGTGVNTLALSWNQLSLSLYFRSSVLAPPAQRCLRAGSLAC